MMDPMSKSVASSLFGKILFSLGGAGKARLEVSAKDFPTFSFLGSGGLGSTGVHSDSVSRCVEPLDTGKVILRVACWACFSTGVSTGSWREFLMFMTMLFE